MQKRITSLLLALCMALTLMPVAALAEEPMGKAQARADSQSWIPYRIKGGNIYFDPTSGTIKDCDENIETVDIPTTIDGVDITSIGSGAFFGCNNLTKVTIPDGITSIGENAFWKCKNLTSITISDSIRSIRKGTFCDCCALTSVTIPTYLESGF